mmetsp:Transcript_98600/g.317899  ORF Transcript_98600/g.317899 Transcript_98600/m.317899 type:complete len:782 (-) Transcript_98600:805-3150(-)
MQDGRIAQRRLHGWRDKQQERSRQRTSGANSAPSHCNTAASGALDGARSGPGPLEVGVPPGAVVLVLDEGRQLLLVPVRLAQAAGREARGDVRRRRLQALQRAEVHPLQQGLRGDLRGAADAQAPARAGLQQAGHEGDGRRGPEREVALADARQDLAEDVGRVVQALLVLEGRGAAEQLVGEDAERPPVHHAVVARVPDDLRRDVLRGAADGHRLAEHKLGKAEVAQLYVSVGVNQQVLGLEVAEDDVPLVDVRQRADDAGDDEAVHARRPEAGREAVHVRVEVPAEHGLKDEVEVVVVLERPVQPRHEGAVDHRQDLALVVHAVPHLLLSDQTLGERLQRHELPRLAVALQRDDAEAPRAEDAHALQGARLEPRVQLRLALQPGGVCPLPVVPDLLRLLEPWQEALELLRAAALIPREVRQAVLGGVPELRVVAEQARERLEGRAVEHEALCLALRAHPDGELRGRVAQQGPLPEVLARPQRGQLLLLVQQRAPALHEDVPEVLALALTDDPVARLEGRGEEVLRQLQALLREQALQQVHLVQVGDDAFSAVLLRAQHDAAEGALAHAPDDGVLARDRRGRPRRVVEQRELAEGVPCAAQGQDFAGLRDLVGRRVVAGRDVRHRRVREGAAQGLLRIAVGRDEAQQLRQHGVPRAAVAGVRLRPLPRRQRGAAESGAGRQRGGAGAGEGRQRGGAGAGEGLGGGLAAPVRGRRAAQPLLAAAAAGRELLHEVERPAPPVQLQAGVLRVHQRLQEPLLALHPLPHLGGQDLVGLAPLPFQA